MQRDVVRLAQQRPQVDEPHGRVRPLRLGHGRRAQHRHPEGARQPGDHACRGAVADQSQGRAAQFATALPRPTAPGDAERARHQAAGGGEQQGQGVLGDRVAVDAGQVADRDAQPGGGVDVDRVVADPRADQCPQRVSPAEDVGRHGLVGDDRALHVVQRRDELVDVARAGVGEVADPVSGRGEQGLDLLVVQQVVGGDQDQGHRHSTFPTPSVRRRANAWIRRTAATASAASRPASSSMKRQPVMSTMPPTAAGPTSPPSCQVTVYSPV